MALYLFHYVEHASDLLRKALILLLKLLQTPTTGQFIRVLLGTFQWEKAGEYFDIAKISCAAAAECSEELRIRVAITMANYAVECAILKNELFKGTRIALNGGLE